MSAVVGFNPIALRMLAATVLRSYAQSSVPGLPPHVSAEEVLMCILQQPVVGRPDLKPAFRQVKAHSPARRAFGIEIVVAAVRGEPAVVADRNLVVGDRRSAQHAADA